MTRWHKMGLGKLPYYDTFIEILANTKRKRLKQKMIKIINVLGS